MLLSTMVSQARRLANDTDTGDPFHTDAQIYEFLSNWLKDIAIKLKYPRKSQAISFAVGDGGAAGQNLDNDTLMILGVWYEPSSGTGAFRLRPITEAKLTAISPDWRRLGNASPTYYLLLDAVTAQANEQGPLRQISTDRTVDAARTMRIYSVQSPAAVTAGTNSPQYLSPFHISGVYHAVHQMLLPRDEKRADYFYSLYLREVREKKSIVHEFSDDTDEIWDAVQVDYSEAKLRAS